MTPKAFINALRRVVVEAAITGTEIILRKPPGRRPDADLVKTSEWFRALSPEEQKFARNVARLAVDQAVFGFLAVLDGVRRIDEEQPSGRFELRFIRGNIGILINSPDEAQLHDLLTEAQRDSS